MPGWCGGSALSAAIVLLHHIGALAVARHQLSQHSTDVSVRLAAEVGADARSIINQLNNTWSTEAQRTLFRRNDTTAIDDIVFDRLPPPPTDDDVDRFMTLYGLETRQLPRSDDIVYFLHVSKSAGTFFCDCGRKQGRNSGLDVKENCHHVGEDYPVWGTPPWPLPPKNEHTHNCSQMFRYYKYKGISLEGNENFLPPHGQVCPQVYSVLLMRSPMHRLMSHLAYLLGQDVWSQTPDSIFTRFPIMADNYYVRSLRGYDVFRRGLGDIHRSDLDIAKKTLRKFDQVLIVDHDLTSNVESQLGWSCWHVEGRRSTVAGGTQRVLDGLRDRWGESEFQRLEDLNRFDQELFEEARMLSRASKHAR